MARCLKAMDINLGEAARFKVLIVGYDLEETILVCGDHSSHVRKCCDPPVTPAHPPADPTYALVLRVYLLQDCATDACGGASSSPHPHFSRSSSMHAQLASSCSWASFSAQGIIRWDQGRNGTIPRRQSAEQLADAV